MIFSIKKLISDRLEQNEDGTVSRYPDLEELDEKFSSKEKNALLFALTNFFRKHKIYARDDLTLTPFNGDKSLRVNGFQRPNRIGWENAIFEKQKSGEIFINVTVSTRFADILFKRIDELTDEEITKFDRKYFLSVDYDNSVKEFYREATALAAKDVEPYNKKQKYAEEINVENLTPLQLKVYNKYGGARFPVVLLVPGGEANKDKLMKKQGWRKRAVRREISDVLQSRIVPPISSKNVLDALEKIYNMSVRYENIGFDAPYGVESNVYRYKFRQGVLSKVIKV